MKVLNPKYLAMKYKTPHDLKNLHSNSKILILGTGPSTRGLVKYKQRLKDYFDAVVGVNFSIKDFENEMDYHVVSEKDAVEKFLNQKNGKIVYSKGLVRVFNWKTIKRYPADMTFIKSNRNDFDGQYNVREYRFNGTEGLISGPRTSDNLSAGTVVLQAMHLACILGAKEIYLSGADFLFSKDLDHYYNDRLYRDTKRNWQTPIVEVKHNGKTHKTLQYFKESADYLNSFIETLNSNGISVYSFYDGLLTKAIKINIDDLME